jgi:F0F1-type ATP synthase membrane subunit a
MPQTMLALFNIGAGEILLILILLLILAVPVVVTAIVILLIVRANKRKQPISPGSVPPRIPPANT